MDLGGGLGHLTYSTLVHPGDTWAEMNDSIRRFLPAVKAAHSPDAPFAFSLRLSAASAAELAADAERRAELTDWLRNEGLYLITANAFPYGAFKGGPVKERVYEPDWSTDQRRHYTTQVAEILAELAPPGVAPSIQTAPLAFAPRVEGPGYVEAFTRNVLAVVAALVDIERRTGRTVRLAIEPEPYCYLATTPQTVEYFRTRLYSAEAARTLAELADLALSSAHGALRRHVGVVFDICHQAVEFEDIAESLELLADAGIPVFKLQEAAALWIPEVDRESVDELEKYADTIYLTQTTELRNGVLRRFLNIEDAIAAWRQDPGPCEWRTHFHVPVFLDDLGPFRTTQFAIRDALAVHRRRPVSDHLEIETYTFDVLPDHLRTGGIVEYVIRELDWVRTELGVGAG
ncbi:metabolite traffic protein EboE [Candidatus Poriferisocius sp.]|uniref:metabolite traffic protein EboE n=1 Tax=Candidatus Poriferisocius sp. TaxID=3101276 RepID=UPI003B5C3843